MKSLKKEKEKKKCAGFSIEWFQDMNSTCIIYIYIYIYIYLTEFLLAN